MKNFGRLIVVVLLGLVTAGAAQDAGSGKEASKKKETAKSEAMSMPMPKPAPEMDKLAKAIAGSWTTRETIEVSEMAPKGGKGSGTATIKLGPGGLSLIEDYHSRGGMGAFSGHGVFWWDDQAKGYRNVWCDNLTPGGCTVANGLGKWDGDSLVFDDEQEMMGKKYLIKNVLTPGAGGFSFALHSGETADSMKKMMTIQYSKAGAKGEAKPGN